MKKLIFTTLCALALLTTSCSDDDDNPNCRECDVFGIPIAICDNGDGTVTVSGGGQSETETLPEGVTFEEFVETTCNTITIGI